MKRFLDFEAIIFDMDGVLIDSERIWQTKEPDFITNLFPEYPAEECHKFAGRSAQGIFELLHSYNSRNITEEDFLTQFRAFGSREIYSEVSSFDGLPTLLDTLSAQKKMAVASSSLIDWVETAMNETGFKKYFSAICSAEEIGGVSKPRPDIFLYAAEKLQVSPEKCLVIEDAHSGVLAAKNANMTVWGFRNGVNDQQDFSQADFVFDDFRGFF
jgi:HAD superfamily hydrolase (TIGR01509 family)